MSRGKKRLFIDATPLMGDNPSGIGKVILSHITELTRDDHFMKRYDVTLFVSLGKTHTLKKWKFNKAVNVRELPLPLRVINMLIKMKMMPPVDIYLGRGTYLFGNYRWLPLIKSKSLTFVHDAVYDKFPETVQPKNRAYLEKVIPIAFRHSNLILTLTNESKRELTHLFYEYASKIRVVPCGIDQQQYTPRNENDIDTTLKKVGVRKGGFILFVGNIEPRKNIDYLLDVYTELIKRKKIPDTTALVLVGGDGWNNHLLLEKIDRLSREYTIIRPTSRLTDQEIADLYAVTKITCLLSIHEGFGITPLEAMSAGSKVAVSDIPVLREVNGDAVTYVTLKNLQSATQQVAEAINGTTHTKAVDEVLHRYTWRNATQTLIKYIDEL